MEKMKDRASLEAARKDFEREIESSKCRVLICAGTGCMAGGSG